ncbi:MAG: flagellar motor switch protein FliM [Leifsonia sp.]
MTLQDVRSAPARERTVEPYDFRRPTSLAREQSRMLELAFETFARAWGTQMTAEVRVISHATCLRVTMQSYDEYAAALPSTTAMVLCTIGDTAAKAVVQFPAPDALGWVHHMLGGHAGESFPERAFTPIEHALVRRILDDALEDLQYAFGALLVDTIAVDGVQYNSQFAQAAPTNELMIVAEFALTVGERETRATVAIPASCLLPRLGSSVGSSAPGDARSLVEAQVQTVPVEVSLRLTAASVRPGDVLGLAVGDVIPLPHPEHRPLHLSVHGETLAEAAVGTSGSRRALVVVSMKESSR